MALEAAFKDLGVHLHTLCEGLLGLRTTVVEDKPLRGDSVLVDVFGNAADDLLGWSEEALAAAREGQQACRHPIDLHGVQGALTTCQERFNRITYQFSSDLIHYERIAELRRFGRQRGGEWRAWTNSIKEALNECQQLLFDVNQTLFRCWQEMAERASMTFVSVRATNVGPRLTVREDSDLARETTT